MRTPADPTKRNGVSVTLLVVAVSFVMSFDAAYARPVDADAAQAVRKAHSTWFERLLAEDTTGLDQLLADDVTLAFPDGNLMPRADFLSYLKSGALFYYTAEHEDVLVRIYGTTGVVTGRSNLAYRFKGKAGLERLRYTAVYARTGGRWRLVASHSTVRREQ